MCGIAGIRGLVMDKGAEQDQINNAKAVVHSGLERPEPIQSHSPVHGILLGRAPVNFEKPGKLMILLGLNGCLVFLDP